MVKTRDDRNSVPESSLSGLGSLLNEAPSYEKTLINPPTNAKQHNQLVKLRVKLSATDISSRNGIMCRRHRWNPRNCVPQLESPIR